MKAKRFMRKGSSITADEFKKLTAKKKPSKFRNKRTEVDGIKFDSKKEAERWLMLKAMEADKRIHNLRRQVRFSLEVNGQVIGAYVADFVYEERGMFQGIEVLRVQVIEDVKSDFTRKNPVYILKKKLMKAIHNIDIREV